MQVVKVKKVAILLMILWFAGVSTIQTSILPTGLVAYADEVEDGDNGENGDVGGEEVPETEVEERETPGNKDNVMKIIGTDAVKRGRVLGSIKYNEQMQYLMTYTILKGKYMEIGGYSSIYTDGNFAIGARNGLEGVGVQAGYGNIILGEGEDPETSHDRKTDEERAEEQRKRAEVNNAAGELTKVITEELIGLYIQKYYLSDEELKERNSAFGLFGWDMGIKVDKNKRGTSAEVTKYTPEFTEDNGKYRLIGEKIEDKVKGYVSTKREFLVFTGGDILDASISLDYRKQYLYKQGKDAKFVLGGGEYMVPYDDITAEEMREDLRFYPLRATSLVLNEKGGWNYDNEFEDEYDAWGAEAFQRVKNSDAYKTYAELTKGYHDDIEQGREEVMTGDISGLAWLPLTLKVTDEMKAAEKYPGLISAFDGGRITTDNKVELVDKEGKVRGLRPVQVNDIFNMPYKKDGKVATSASPYFSYDYEEFRNKNNGGAYMGVSEYELGEGLSKYSGMKMEKVKGNPKDWVKGIFGMKNGVGVANTLTTSDFSDSRSGKLYPHMAISSMATNIKNIENLENHHDYVLGIDNYGNIISGTTLAVVVPYWHNTEVTDFKGFNDEGSYYISTPILNSVPATDTVAAMDSSSGAGVPKEASANIGGLSFVSDTSPYQSFLSNVGQYAGNTQELKKALKGSDDGVVNTQALAMAIVAGTKSEVDNFNKRFVSEADLTNELYMQPTNAGFDTARASDDDLLQQYTNKDLLDRLMMILDVGFFELMRLTIASWVVSFYTSTVTNFSMASVFHTSLITDTAMWSEVVRSLSFLLMGFVGVYILIMAFRVFRRTMSGGDFIKQFVAVTLVLIIPTTVYSPLIHTTINKPTQGIVGTQMEQMSLLDAYLMEEMDRREQDVLYKKLFGSVEDVRSRSDDYIINFYTTRHVDGFDVTNVQYEDLSYKNQFRSIASQKSGEWRKTDLIKVRVSIFDLFKWVESEDDIPLFDWLVAYDSKRYGGIIDYEEFKTSTAVSYPELGVNEAGEVWKASDLYRKMYRDTKNAEVKKNISSLYFITEAFRNRGNEKAKAKITDTEREGLVRDLAMTAESRKTLYGDGSQMAPSSAHLVEKYGGEKMATKNGMAVAPEDDFLALANIVNHLVPYRDMTTTTLDRDVYNINKKVIDNYIANYSIVRETVGDKPGYQASEFNMIVMQMWFSVNEVLELPMFPRTYEVDSISFDSYMRLAFIPMDAFANIEEKDLENVSQYLALREHPMSLLFGFLPALILLMAFGMIYIAVFFVLMMVVLTGSFIWNYVIKNNKDNKSWLGALMIIGSFALAKIGLLFVWKAMTYFLNYTFILKGGITYPYGFLHSLIIVVYLYIIIRYLFLNVLKAVLKDKGNLGGEVFSQGVSKMVGGVMDRAKGLHNLPGDMMKGAGNSVKKALDNEGEDGKIKALAGGFSIASLKQMVSDRRGQINETEDDIKAIEEALNATGESGQGKEFVNRFGEIVPGLSGAMGEQLAEDYDSIHDEGIGLTKDEQNALESAGSIGGILSTTADGSNITTIDALTPENAELIASQLTQRDIKSTVDGNKVYFNSQGLNLDSETVRKGLYGGVINKILKETDKVSTPKVEDVEGVMDYVTNEDGTVDIGIGKTGIDTDSLGAVLESQSFKESFEVLQMPVVKDGKYLQGTMKVAPRRDSVDVANVMGSVYKVDETMRNIRGVEEREDINLTKGVKITSDEENSVAITSNMVEGMRIQEGKILFNDKNEEHVKSMTTITSELKKGRDEKQVEKADVMMRMVSQVTEGGNHGFKVSTVNTAEDTNIRTFAQATGLVSDKVDTKVFVGKEVTEVTENLQQMRNVINAKPEVVDKYLSTRDELYQEGERILMGKDESSEKVLNEMSKYASKNKVEEKKVETIMNRYKKLGEQRTRSEIKESEYNTQVEGLMADMQVLLQDEGKYDQLMAETIRKDSTKGKKSSKNSEKALRNTQLLDNYVSSKQEMTGQGINIDTLEKYQREDFDIMGQLIGDIDEVKGNGDGTVSISSYSKLNEDEMSLLVDDILQVGADKSSDEKREQIIKRKKKIERLQQEEEERRIEQKRQQELEEKEKREHEQRERQEAMEAKRMEENMKREADKLEREKQKEAEAEHRKEEELRIQRERADREFKAEQERIDELAKRREEEREAEARKRERKVEIEKIKGEFYEKLRSERSIFDQLSPAEENERWERYRKSQGLEE